MLLNQYEGIPRVYWKQHQGNLSFIAFGMIEELLANGEDRFSDIEEKTREIFENFDSQPQNIPSYVKPRIFGGFSFQIDEKQDKWWQSFPEAKMILPKILFTMLYLYMKGF